MSESPELKGFFYPRTVGGTSGIIPSPPWYYSGDLLTVEYRTNPERVRELLDAGLVLEQLRELPWKESNESTWGGWSP